MSNEKKEKREYSMQELEDAWLEDKSAGYGLGKFINKLDEEDEKLDKAIKEKRIKIKEALKKLDEDEKKLITKLKLNE